MLRRYCSARLGSTGCGGVGRRMLRHEERLPEMIWIQLKPPTPRLIVAIAFGIFFASTAAADDVCLPRAELEAAASQLDQALDNARRCIAEAHTIRTQRDMCRGKLENKEVQIRAIQLELDDIKSRNELLRDAIESRVSGWLWFGIGVGVPVAGFVAWKIVD